MQISKKINRLRKNKSNPNSSLLLKPRKVFERQTELPKLIGLWPSDLRDYSFEGTAKIIALLNKALRIERRRGSGGHWTYDLNRHLALSEALKFEKARLRGVSHYGLNQTYPNEKPAFKSAVESTLAFAKNAN